VANSGTHFKPHPRHNSGDGDSQRNKLCPRFCAFYRPVRPAPSGLASPRHLGRRGTTEPDRAHSTGPSVKDSGEPACIVLEDERDRITL
jgi:hypothetical protein